MSTHSPTADDGSGSKSRGSAVESWRWHLDSPEEVAGFARLLNRGGRVVEIRSRGTSMGSTLPDGTLLRFRSGSRDVTRGDVVVVLAGPADLIVHRVVARGWGPRARDYIVTRGDDFVLCDQPIRGEAVLGVVEEQCREGQWCPVGPPASRGLPLTAAAGVLRVVMVGALAISPRLAVRVAAGSYELVHRLRGLRPGRAG